MTKMITNNINIKNKKTFPRGDVWDVHGSGLAGETPLFWFKSLILSLRREIGEV